MASHKLIAALVALVAAALPVLAQGKVFLTTDEALGLAFPGCQILRKEHVLEARQRARIAELSGQAAPRAIVFCYEARRDGVLVGTAWFDRHRVRSLQELLMIVVGPDGRCVRTEVLAFGEPVDYLPRATFYAQLVGRPLDAELSTKRAIRGVAGATLTVDATLAAVRRVLAAHAVVYPDQQPKAAPEPAPKPAPAPAPAGKSAPEPTSDPVGGRPKA